MGPSKQNGRMGLGLAVVSLGGSWRGRERDRLVAGEAQLVKEREETFDGGEITSLADCWADAGWRRSCSSEMKEKVNNMILVQRCRKTEYSTNEWTSN